jgi:hypothetical protein
MRKRLLLICLCIAAVLCLATCNGNVEDSEEYFYKINKLIKDEDFCTAEVKPGKIVLYDDQKKPIRELPFESYDKSIDFLYARKEGALIFFVTSAAVDDEQGILFINDDSNNMLDGIHSIKRVGRNSYEYDTAG